MYLNCDTSLTEFGDELIIELVDSPREAFPESTADDIEPE